MSLKELKQRNERANQAQKEQSGFFTYPEQIPTNKQELTKLFKKAFKEEKEVDLMKECTRIMTEYPKNTNIYKNAVKAHTFFCDQMAEDYYIYLRSNLGVSPSFYEEFNDEAIKFMRRGLLFYDENKEPSTKARDGAVVEKPIKWVDNLPSQYFAKPDEPHTFLELCNASRALWEAELKDCMMNDPEHEARLLDMIETKNRHKGMFEKKETLKDYKVKQILNPEKAEKFEERAEEFVLLLHAKREVLMEHFQEKLDAKMTAFEQIDFKNTDKEELDYEIKSARSSIDYARNHLEMIESTDEYFTCPAFDKFEEMKVEMQQRIERENLIKQEQEEMQYRKDLKNLLDKKSKQIANAKRIKNDDLSR